LLIIDPDSVAFLLALFRLARDSHCRGHSCGAVAAPALALSIRSVFRERYRRACRPVGLAGLAAAVVAVPDEAWEPFQGVKNHTIETVRAA